MSNGSPELERARRAALSGDYQETLISVDLWLQAHPEDVFALLLKGNALELEVLSTCTEGASFENCPQLHAAKLCYERVLEIEPCNTDAITDLANLEKGAKRYQESAALFRRALLLLRGRNAHESAQECEQELQEVLHLERGKG